MNHSLFSLEVRDQGRWSRACSAWLLLGALLLPLLPARGQSLQWDANAGGDGVADGGGAWDSTTANWWTGSTNVTWDNSGGVIAVFGNGGVAGTAAGQGVISVSGTVQAGGLDFQALDLSGTNRTYTFSNGTISLADGAFIRIANGVTNTGVGRLTFNSTLAGSNITFEKTGNDLGLVTLTGSNTWTGTLTLANTAGGGGLFINVTNLAALTSLDQISVLTGNTLVVNYGQTGLMNVPMELAGTGSGNRGAIRFDTSRTISSAITLAGNTSIAANTAGTPVGTLAGSIGESGGSRSLSINTNNSANTIVLAADNTFTGGVTVNAGVLRIGHAGALNTAAPNRLNFAANTNAKTVALDGFSISVAGLSQAGTTDVVTVENASSTPATLTLVNSAETSFLGTLADGAGGGALTLVKSGAGTQILSGATSTYSGGTVLQEGILRISGDGSLGAVPGALDADNLVFDGGTLQFAFAGSEGGPSLAATRGITLLAGGGTLDTLTNTTYYAGPVTGAGSLAKGGTGRLILAGASDFTGETVVNAGILEIRNALALGGTEGGTTVLAGARLELSGGITVTGEAVATPYLAGISGENVWAGTVQGAVGATLTFESAVASGLTVTGDVNAADVGGTAHSVILTGAGSGQISGAISNSLTVTKNGAGTWTLSGDNTFTNGVNLTQGELVLGSLGAVNAGAPNTITFTNNANSKLLTVLGTSITGGLASSTAAGAVVQNGGGADATLILQTTTNRTFHGAFTDGAGGGSLSLVKTGAATQILGGASTHTGSTTVLEGTLRLDFNLGTAPASQILGAGTALVLGGGTFALTGGGNVANSQTLAGLTVAPGASTLSVTEHAGTPQDLVLSLGEITVQNGGRVNFILPSGAQTATNGIRTTTPNSGGILGGWATVGGDWAAVVDGNITAYNGYTDVTRLSSGAGSVGPLPNDAEANVRIINGGESGDIQPGNPGGLNLINSIQQTATGAATLDTTSGTTLRLGVSGGIMLATGAGDLVIGRAVGNGGVLSAGGGAAGTEGALIFTDHSAGQTVTVNSGIQNNGAGAVTVVKNGPGTLVIAGASGSNYSGGLIVNGGMVRASADGAFGAAPGAADEDNITLNGGGLQLGAAFTIHASRGITLLTGGGTLDTQGFNTTYSGVISGGGSLTKLGAGTLTLGAASTFDGVLNLDAGNIQVNHNQALGSTAGGTIVAAGAILRLNSGVTVTGETLTIHGAGNNQGNLQVQSGTATWAGDILIGSNAARIGTGSSTGVLVIDGVIRNGAGGSISYVGLGGGVVVLNSANTYTGSSTIIRGTVRLGTNNALPVTTELVMLTNTVVTETLSLDLNGHDQTLGALRHQVVSNVDNNFVTNSQAGTTSTLTVNQSTNTTYHGRIEGNIALVKDGAGTLTFTSFYNTATPVPTQHTYTGRTLIQGGTLALSGNGNLTGTPWIQVDEGALFSISGRADGAYSLAGSQVLSGAGSVNGHLILTGDSRLSPGGSSGILTAQAGDGTGRLTLENLTLTGSALPTLRAVFHLGGTGSNLDDPDALGNVTYFANAGSGGLYDSLLVNGTLALNAGASLRVELLESYTPREGDVFNLLDWSSINLDADGPGGWEAFSVADLDLNAANAALAPFGWYFETDRFISHGLIYVVVPEPGRALLTGLGLAALLLRRRR